MREDETKLYGQDYHPGRCDRVHLESICSLSHLRFEGNLTLHLVGDVALTQGRHQEVVCVGGVWLLPPPHLSKDLRQGRPLFTSWAMIVAIKAQREHLAVMTWLCFVRDLGP